ncbi:mycothiol synthase [Streptomyces sp. BI20]|uniref:mycothiol synthase n=1 Tax=Streptomyces sp. BI20 TaxID=3403460 RepID=UPI003C7082C1
MTDTNAAPTVEPARRILTLPELTQRQAADVLELIEHAVRVDGASAVSEQGRLHLAGGLRPGITHFLLFDGERLAGYGQLEDTDPVEAPAAELVVHPALRGRGHGRALGGALLAASGKRLRAWAHGGKSGARHLAQVLGLTLFRELRQLRRPLVAEPGREFTPLPEPVWPAGVTVRTFVPGRDEEAWLAANAAAFAHHPEQGSLDARDLADRMAQPWFDPAGFFLAERDGELVGFHWTKRHEAEDLGEVYVVGVLPTAQGGGLGKALTAVGLRHLSESGLPTAMLYVDADNPAALSVYEGLGFTTHAVDLMYRTET